MCFTHHDPSAFTSSLCSRYTVLSPRNKHRFKGTGRHGFHHENNFRRTTLTCLDRHRVAVIGKIPPAQSNLKRRYWHISVRGTKQRLSTTFALNPGRPALSEVCLSCCQANTLLSLRAFNNSPNVCTGSSRAGGRAGGQEALMINHQRGL